MLNSPGVVKLSKIEFIREKYGEVFLRFDPGSVNFKDSVIFQSGFALKVVEDTVPSNKPCYVFKKIAIQGDSAYVLLYFDITDFIADGKLKYLDGKWIPDSAFQVGYR